MLASKSAVSSQAKALRLANSSGSQASPVTLHAADQSSTAMAK